MKTINNIFISTMYYTSTLKMSVSSKRWTDAPKKIMNLKLEGKNMKKHDITLSLNTHPLLYVQSVP